MSSITIDATLEERLFEVAGRLEKPVKEITDEAIRAYLEWLDRLKLEAEIQAFEKIHEQLKKRFLHQFVAIHNGQVLDNDSDFETLFLRVRARLGNTCVLIRQVEDSPITEWRFYGQSLKYT